MSIDRRAGMTLIELVLAIVIISVGVAGVMAAFSTVVRGSADPLIRKQMLTIADEMMEEIALKPFPVTANVAPAGCARNTYNDVLDYNGYASPANTICDIDGTAIASLSGYSVSVSVVADATLTAITAANAYKITVTVLHTGAPNLKLTGWRTWYSCALPTICPP